MPKHCTTPDTNDDEEYVIGRLAEIGIRAEQIASSSKQKSCDLRAADDQARYLIEVKARRSDEAIAKILRKEGATGLMHHSMGFSPSTEKTMRRAVDQLDAIAGGEGAFKLIGYCIDPQYRDGATLTQQVIDTPPLFQWFDAEPGGVVDVHALEADGAVLLADCDIAVAIPTQSSRT
jgi:hypothetical protein